MNYDQPTVARLAALASLIMLVALAAVFLPNETTSAAQPAAVPYGAKAVGVGNAPNLTPTPACTPSTVGVSIENLAFNPQVLDIHLGQTVQWTNNDVTAAHSTTSDSLMWDSGNLTPGQSFSYTFTAPGMYPYHCRIHPTMTGTIRVSAGCAPPPALTATPTATLTPRLSPTPTFTFTHTSTPVPTVQLCSQTLINILDHGPNPTDTPGPGLPYPSTIAVSGMSGFVSNVRVVLNNVNHTFPDDLDVLLVAPDGRKVLLMSDAGGTNDLSGVTLTFDDSGPTLPDNALITSGTYHPTDYPGNDPTPDYFNPPAPAGPYSTALSTFNGVNPNGAWRLYAQDDQNGDTGTIAQGWCLQLTVAPVANTPTRTSTPTATPTRFIIVHVNWQGAPVQPHPRQSQPISLTLKMDTLEVNFPTSRTDDHGFVSYTLPTLPGGTYSIRTKGPRSLAKGDLVGFDPQPDPPGEPFRVEMGLQRMGDCNNDNIVNIGDFTILKNTFSSSTDLRADYDNNGVIAVADFNLQKGNFGQIGDPGIRPGP
jgi:plastocyanin/subtilisin-like proprotein convertase family protein